VPVDDEHCKMMGWRVFGPHIDPRGVGKRELVGFESIDFLEGQVAMRRPERFGKYKLTDLPPIPDNHRERSCYKEAQWAPGDYEAVVSQRRIAVHALETPMKFDGGLYLFRKLLRDAIHGTNRAASPENFRAWLGSVEGAPNTYCSGNILEVAEAPTMEDEVRQRRLIARRMIDILTESDRLRGEAREQFIMEKFAEAERSFG